MRTTVLPQRSTLSSKGTDPSRRAPSRTSGRSDIPLHNSDLPKGTHTRYKLRSAAVLIPLLRQEDSWQVLYIRRSRNENDRHSGQVAFPGGASDPIDTDAVATALRETHEEIGIRQENIRVVGTLPNYETISYFNVTPVVALLDWPCNMKLEPSEVARAFTIPLDWLLDNSNYELRTRQPRKDDNFPPDAKRPKVVHYDEYDGEILWGASARITLNFLHALCNGQLLVPGYTPDEPRSWKILDE